MNTELCYFCDVPYTVIDYKLIKNYNNLWVCSHCEKKFPINYDNRVNGKCCICLNDNLLIKQQKCYHYLCVSCFKKEYFGVSKEERPMHWHESYNNNIIEPDWPFQIDDDEYNENNEELFRATRILNADLVNPYILLMFFFLYIFFCLFYFYSNLYYKHK